MLLTSKDSLLKNCLTRRKAQLELENVLVYCVGLRSTQDGQVQVCMLWQENELSGHGVL